MTCGGTDTSFVIATPEMMTSAATDLTAIGSNVSAATLAEITEFASLAEDSPVDQILALRREGSSW